MEKTITNIKNTLSTGLDPLFDRVEYVTIQADTSFQAGGFGHVYPCVNINGQQPATQQVIKILKDTDDSATRGMETIRKLQQRLAGENRLLIQSGKEPITETYPGLKGVPQLSFEGELDGEEVFCIASNNLLKMGFTELKDFGLEPGLNLQYQELDFQKRLVFAFCLVEAFEVLSRCRYIHADIKEEALFLSLQQQECAIIDFDSGAFFESANDKPTTWGARQPWLAPEIWAQLGQFTGRMVDINLNTDLWSVNVAIHHLLFNLLHPYFFLTEESSRSLRASFPPSHRWPEVDRQSQYFEKDEEEMYDLYRQLIERDCPRSILGKLAHTFNEGYEAPHLRTSYGQWEHLFKGTREAMRIELASTTGYETVEGEETVIEWKVERAKRLMLEPFGPVDGTGTKRLKMSRTAVFRLKAKNHYNEYDGREITIRVHPRPRINGFDVSRKVIKAGESVELTWDTANADRIFLNDEDVTLLSTGGKGSREVLLSATTQWVLSVHSVGSIVKVPSPVREVKVVGDLEVVSFMAEPSFTVSTMPVMLRWEVRKAETIRIEPGIGDVTGLTEKEVFPNETTLYRLIAANHYDTDDKHTATVVVMPMPRINELELPFPKIKGKVLFPSIAFGFPRMALNLPRINLNLSITADGKFGPLRLISAPYRLLRKFLQDKFSIPKK